MSIFTIIIATHNADKDLKKTLDSILKQTTGDYEVLIIDGKSTDDTLKIVEGYEPKFSGRLQVVSEPDKGIYDAMNKGIKMAQGEWLYFLGAGDYLYDSKVLADVASLITAKPGLDVVYGNMQWGQTDVISHGRFSKAKLINLNLNHQTIFCKKSVFEKTGLFDIKYKIAADYLFNIRWFTDLSIKKRYLNRIVAVYDTEGVSSVAKDTAFEADKPSTIRQYFNPLERLLGFLWLTKRRVVKASKMIFTGKFTEAIKYVLGRSK